MSEERIFITSDTHFGHHNIIEYEARPFQDVEEMNHELIKRWNQVVGPKDLVYFLGDFGMGRSAFLREVLFNLNGQISIVRGNHDDSLTKLIEIGFSLVADQLDLEYMGMMFIFTHQPQLLMHSDGVVNIHGHIHGKTQFTDGKINVSTDAWDYKPVELKQLIKQYRQFKARLK